MTPTGPRDAAIQAVVATLRTFQAADNGVAAAAPFDQLPPGRQDTWLRRGAEILDAGLHALAAQAPALMPTLSEADEAAAGPAYAERHTNPYAKALTPKPCDKCQLPHPPMFWFLFDESDPDGIRMTTLSQM